MSNTATTETRPAAPATSPPIEKIKVKVDGRDIAGATSDMKFAASPQH